MAPDHGLEIHFAAVVSCLQAQREIGTTEDDRLLEMANELEATGNPAAAKIANELRALATRAPSTVSYVNVGDGEAVALLEKPDPARADFFLCDPVSRA